MKAVVDTSVLISLGKLGFLGLIREMFDSIVVAKSVFEEVRDSEVAEKVNGLIEAGEGDVVESSNKGLLDAFSSSLGKGEAETIALALEFKTSIALLDDLRARKTARRLGIEVMGTLGVLKVLSEMGLVSDKPEDLCRKLTEQGFWIDGKLCMRILKE